MIPVRFGLIGCSSIAKRRFVPALTGSSTARLERVGSRDAARAKHFADTWGCRKYGSYDDVMVDPDVDAVYISTPPALHETWARAAIKNRKHILCEKPAFTSYESAVELVELSRESGVRIMEGYMFRYHPQHAVAMALLAEGRIGPDRAIQGEFSLPYPATGNYRLQPELGGGVFLDAAGYPVALALLLHNAMPVSIYCQIKVDESNVESAVSMILDFSGGRVVHALAVYGAYYRSHYMILGSQGTIEAPRAFAVPPEMKTELIIDSISGRQIVPVAPADQFQLMIDDFCAQIQSGSRSRSFEDNLLRQQAVMEAARCSNAQRRPVFLSEISPATL